jgi:hypothetical protein
VPSKTPVLGYAHYELSAGERVHHLDVAEFLVAGQVWRRGPGGGVHDVQPGLGQADANRRAVRLPRWIRA